MGKEAKIGLSIIGILVIIFAIVLGQRLFSSGDDIAKKKEKPTTSKKANVEKPGDSKKSRFSPFKLKDQKKQTPASSNAEEKVPLTRAANQSLYGTGNASDKSIGNWSRNQEKTATGGTSLGSYQGRGSLGTGSSGLSSSRYGDGSYPYRKSDNYSSGSYAPSTGSQAAAPAPGPGVLSTSPHSHSPSSPYRTPSSPYQSQNDRYANHQANGHQPGNYRHDASGRYGSDTSGTYSNSGYRNPPSYKEASFSPRTGGTQLDSSRSYDRYRSPSGYSAGSGYSGSSSYSSSSYDTPGYGSATSNSAGYSGGAQSDGTYIVKPHQNFWAISKDVYGTGAYFKALAEANRGGIPDENNLKVGDRIKTPDLVELEQKYPQLCPAPERREIMQKRAKLASSSPRYGGTERQYIVQSGDTLYDIARFELGDAARWTEIYELNRQTLQDSFDYLTPGLKLSMPSKDGKLSTSKTDDKSPSQYGRTGESYRNDTPRTASRPGYSRYGTSGTTSQPSSYGTSNYGNSNYNNSNYQTPSYNSSPYQPSTTYSR